uniref:Uncharacterized protein n=1 Tax=Nelumbo nucifera TaxID=4432 RepID=A0A822XV83_NELNU|nr:TPA_asm: hypothetical protein HUJ06_024178 [Nelumbo nucifera]
MLGHGNMESETRALGITGLHDEQVISVVLVNQ